MGLISGEWNLHMQKQSALLSWVLGIANWGGGGNSWCRHSPFVGFPLERILATFKKKVVRKIVGVIQKGFCLCSVRKYSALVPCGTGQGRSLQSTPWPARCLCQSTERARRRQSSSASGTIRYTVVGGGDPIPVPDC